jgi:hypothetical protein
VSSWYSNHTSLKYKSEVFTAWKINFNKNCLHSVKIRHRKQGNLTCNSVKIWSFQFRYVSIHNEFLKAIQSQYHTSEKRGSSNHKDFLSEPDFIKVMKWCFDNDRERNNKKKQRNVWTKFLIKEYKYRLNSRLCSYLISRRMICYWMSCTSTEHNILSVLLYNCCNINSHQIMKVTLLWYVTPCSLVDV